MTTQRTFKHRVRARMAKTGESYTAARRVLIAKGDRPQVPASTVELPVSDDAMTRGTGHGWEHWFAALDAWGGTSHTHTEIARWLADEHGVPGWWTQSVTVGYERARGMRAPGQHADGWRMSATRTITVPVERLYRAFTDPAERARWLPGAEMHVRTELPTRTARYDWEDGSTRLVAFFTPASDGRSTLSISHERLPDAETADEMKAWWRGRVGALKTYLEGA